MNRLAPIGTATKIVMLDVINSETPDFAEQLHLAIESEKNAARSTGTSQ